MKIKKCTKCGKAKPLKGFYTHQTSRDGYRSECRTCVLQYWKKQYKVKLKTVHWRGHLKRAYDMTLNDYDKMLEAQDGVCAACKRINLDGRRLCVDHNHETGQVRGLLCRHCNIFLGYIERFPGLHLILEKYLKEAKKGK